MHTHTHLTNVIFVYYANIHFIELFYEFCTFIRHYWKKKINSHCELVTSQPHWFSGSQPDISKFSILNNFLIYCPICMKFAPNRLVWEILWLRFHCFRSFSFKAFLPLANNLSFFGWPDGITFLATWNGLTTIFTVRTTHWSMFTSECRWQRRLAVRYNVGFMEQNGCTN